MIKHILGATVIFLGLSACQSHTQIVSNEQLIGTWHVEVVLDTPTINNSPATLVFAPNGELTGNNSCNQFFGRYIQQGHLLQLAPSGSTMKACIDSLITQEAELMQAISLVQQVDFSKGKLNLLSLNGDTLLVLTKQSLPVS
ncbi:META domain-containing protein [Shewanella frigidimarina]|jgi:heat shock protein HslJ|uniref:META domain-containing protein n=1 Tax=Shewanella TaxID=22 RepID=UPI000C7A38EE|nr:MULTISPECIES: META domain-containing protein [Shewanella]MBB1428363.1 META domain-containing protein [Shewanella sp. SG44-2]PKI07434.1 heat-shock protein HslJ [Shewanella sp. 11B5]RPA23708.1 META domain-containing protein [Shewanella frigidimarina]|tara:strand:+ start:10144 stop:10569 length:426 start_codon:yes stop_codon:yes gene_type:complete